MILFAAAFFLVIGTLGLVCPDLIARQFQVNGLTPTGRNEIRAVYGGFGVAMALVLVYAEFVTAAREGVLLVVIVALVGMASGRIISAIVDRTLDRFALTFLVAELAIAAGLLFVRSAHLQSV